jgi:nucleoid-associated protein YgaU
MTAVEGATVFLGGHRPPLQETDTLYTVADSRIVSAGKFLKPRSMRSRFLSAVLCFAASLAPLAAQIEPPAPAAKPTASDAEVKLEVALRSYSLLDAELDKLKAANAQLMTEKAALEAKLAEVQAAVPLAAQAVTLREQLRQTQDQAAKYAEEIVQLKTKLGLTGGEAARAAAAVTPTPIPTTTPAPAAAPAPAPKPAGPRQHVIVQGDTLAKISQIYYGTANRWPEILAANRDVLRDEKSLVIGRALVIP